MYLAPLDKGLSGSSVWLAQWKLRNGPMARLHVLKIGPYDKLRRESTAITDLVSVIEPDFPHHAFLAEKVEVGQGRLALLRQQFYGEATGQPTSLRQAVQRATEPRDVDSLIRELYLDRMSRWYPTDPPALAMYGSTRQSLGHALNSWWRRADIDATVAAIGGHAIEQSFRERFELSIDSLHECLAQIAATEVFCSMGPSHGDLHSQNVLIDSSGRLQVIDYGWTGIHWRAVDFLMMECSLKFLATPPNAQLDDLVRMEAAIDAPDNDQCSAVLEGSMLRTQLDVVATAVRAVRECALATSAVSDTATYRAALALMTAGHSTMPGLNQLCLLHSLAYITRRFSGDAIELQPV